jgi:hypothetical protein|tara:strand:- start:144 stop:269 length:126 start_codon:yes stop_codon:yes gene_type:complete
MFDDTKRAFRVVDTNKLVHFNGGSGIHMCVHKHEEDSLESG